MQEVAVTDHAVSRYQERVRPGLGFDAAVAAWALLGDGIAFPLVRGSEPGLLVAVTCLTQGCRSEERLAVRRERKARRRAARHQNVDDIRGSRRRRDGVAA